MLGSGQALPGNAIATTDLIAMIHQRFGFARTREAAAIAQRLGIEGRHLCRDFAAPDETPRPGDSNAALAAKAVRAALSDAGLKPHDLAYLIGHTTTPDQPLPANVAVVADQLGYQGPHVELRQACTGFANALMIAFGLIATGSGPIAIVGSETGSLFFDPASLDAEADQIVNMVQMGDGAGAVIVGAFEAGHSSIEAAWFGALGSGRAPGISRQHRQHRFDHDFAAIRAEGHRLFDAGRDAAAAQGFGIEAACHVVPHQVSGRIGMLAAAHFALPPEQVFVQADRIGNTGSAAIWIALDTLRASAAPGEDIVVLGAEASKHMYGGFAYRQNHG
ncbi:3-oxoacyl-ACP synthase III family protein [Novosphingobium piscinae]|uniref:3-oxoacyl-ACP synthase III family protein n=1 Tax=Novosphingobium piscinae TaxID=1507448 RepID=UPI003610CF17